MTKEDLRAVADEAAERAIERLFTTIGIDINEPFEMQKDFAYIRTWRKSIETVKSHSLMTAIAVMITGLAGLFYTIFTHRWP